MAALSVYRCIHVLTGIIASLLSASAGHGTILLQRAGEASAARSFPGDTAPTTATGEFFIEVRDRKYKPIAGATVIVKVNTEAQPVRYDEEHKRYILERSTLGWTWTIPGQLTITVSHPRYSSQTRELRIPLPWIIPPYTLGNPATPTPISMVRDSRIVPNPVE